MPNPTDCGERRIASATRRSAAVSDALWILIRSATSTAAHGSRRSSASWLPGTTARDPYLPDDAARPPARSFASDNAAGAHPAVLEAIARGQRRPRARVRRRRRDARLRAAVLRAVRARCRRRLLTFNGTGANVLALTALARPGDAVICSEWAHVNVDETGAPERIAGIKLIDVAAPDGKVTPEHVARPRSRARRLPPCPAGDRVDHAVDRARHGIHSRRDRGAVRRRPPSRHARPHGRRPHRQRGRGSAGDRRRAAGDDDRRRRRRDDVRRHQERHARRRGGRVPRRRRSACAAQYVRKTGDPAAIQDALRRGPVQRPARRRPLARAGRPRQPHGGATAHRSPRHARRRSGPAAGRQQRLPDASAGGDRAAAGVELLLGLGPIPSSGALDDRLGHRSGRHRNVRHRRPARYLPERIDCASSQL